MGNYRKTLKAYDDRIQQLQTGKLDLGSDRLGQLASRITESEVPLIPAYGEKSYFEAENIYSNFSKYGLASKDGSLSNIDNASDKINYKDTDAVGNPIGLITEWTTGSTAVSNGEFVVRLQHQPDVKTSTSTATTGDTDFNLKFVLNIQ